MSTVVTSEWAGTLEVLAPESCVPPHRVTHEEKREELRAAFLEGGYSATEPRLVGYRTGGVVQLLTGSHRWAAARVTGTVLPVVVFPEGVVRHAWGNLPEWTRILVAGDRR